MTDNAHVSLQDCLLQQVLFANRLQLPHLWVGPRVHDKDLLLLVTDRADVGEVPELDCSCSAWTSSPTPLLPAAPSQRWAECWALPQGSAPQCRLKAHLFSLLSLFILHRHFSQKTCISASSWPPASQMLIRLPEESKDPLLEDGRPESGLCSYLDPFPFISHLLYLRL